MNNPEEQNKNKFESNKKYFTISVYGVCVVLICTIGIRCITNWAETSIFISNLLSKLSPFIFGAFLAYVISPLVKNLQNFFFYKFHVKSMHTCRFFGILTAYLFVLGIIVIILLFIVPQLIGNVTKLVSYIPTADQVVIWLNSLEEFFPDYIYNFFESTINEAIPSFFNKASALLGDILPVLYSASVSFVQWIFNCIIAIIISCYALSDSNILIKNFKRACYAFLPEKKANSFIQTLRSCNTIFGGFITGKIIDSLIIGAICLFIFSICNMPLAVLISVIVGITNMIPYFGPFIGAIPGFFIILMVNPKKALLFLVLILVIQQFDGLYLGPKILGNSTGLRPIWIIFAITLGGWAAGPLGMFLGVPVIAVIAFLLDNFIIKKLTEKNILLESAEPPSQIPKTFKKNDKKK